MEPGVEYMKKVLRKIKVGKMRESTESQILGGTSILKQHQVESDEHGAEKTNSRMQDKSEKIMEE